MVAETRELLDRTFANPDTDALRDVGLATLRWRDGNFSRAINGPVFDNGGAVFNVKHPEFGAVGNGMANDQPAIQKALDSGGSTVWLPPGKYCLMTPINIPQGIELVGAGLGVNSPSGTVVPVSELVADSNGDAIVIDDRPYITIAIRNLSVQGSIRIKAPGTGDRGFRDSLIENVLIHDAAGRGLEILDQAYRYEIHRVRAISCGGAGIWSEHGQAAYWHNIYAGGCGGVSDGVQMRFSDAGGGGGAGVYLRLGSDGGGRDITNILFDGIDHATIIGVQSERTAGSNARGVRFASNAAKSDSNWIAGGHIVNHQSGGIGLEIGRNTDVHKTFVMVGPGMHMSANDTDILLGTRAVRCHLEPMWGPTPGDQGIGNLKITDNGFQTSYSEDFSPKWISAALAAGDNNDFSPEGLNRCKTMRVSGAGTGSKLTGLEGGRSLRRLRIINVSNVQVIIKNQSGDSMPANQIISPTGADVPLSQHDVADLEYDTDSGRWRIVNVLQ